MAKQEKDWFLEMVIDWADEWDSYAFPLVIIGFIWTVFCGLMIGVDALLA